MAANDDNHLGSPMHLGLQGQFSDIHELQELLGVMGDGSDTQHHHGGDGGAVVAVSDGDVYTRSSAYDRESNDSATSSAATDPAANQPSDINQSSALVVAGGDASQPNEEAKAHARSERKRSREKQRRSDVNKQFADLTQLLQRIDAENINEDDVKSGTPSSRVTFNPSNRVDLIARTIVLLERLHDANKRRKTDIASLQQQLEEAKKAGEDTAAKLKEAMLAPPGQPMNKQFMMMVPMMMSSDGSGAPAAMPMMNPYMPQAMPQAFCPMPPQAMTSSVAAPSQPGTVPPPAAQAPAVAMATTAQQVPAPVAMMAPQPMAAAAFPQQHHQQGQAPQQQAPSFPYMMAPHMAGGGFMMPIPAPGHTMVGQPMSTMAVQQGTTQESQGQQEQKDSSSGLSGGSNLAHCA